MFIFDAALFNFLPSFCSSSPLVSVDLKSHQNMSYNTLNMTEVLHLATLDVKFGNIIATLLFPIFLQQWRKWKFSFYHSLVRERQILHLRT